DEVNPSPRRDRMSKQLAISIAVAMSFTTMARADDAKPDSLRLTTESAAKPVRKRFLTHANVGLLAATWTRASASGPSKLMTIADRQTVLQSFGFGEFITPNLRVTLSVQLAELAGGAPANASTLAMVAVTPWLGWHPSGPLFVGAGPLVAPRIYGKNQLDLGVFTTAGVAFPLGH